ncbi:F-box protein At2g26160-like [Vicia villosa]|uniref:F-box protein At2g26160-like n=1 Tax=Vicia villosa TaxID=3911 RepID=UPI00273AB02E|nr:F-box protein At2g26160-like [Vicia villosa]
MNMNKKEEECSNSNFPKEVWAVIGQKLNNTIDYIGFRSTCSLWRSLVPLPPSSHNSCIPHHLCSLLQTKIYRIQPSTNDHNPSSSASSCANKGWLIKVFQDPNSSKLYLLDLFTNKRLRIEDTMENNLNLMKFRVVELFELYTLCRKVENDFSFEPNSYVCKVILFPVEDRCMVFELCSNKMLTVSNIGKKKTVLKDDGAQNKYFDDIILYKGQVYVVDKIGTVFWINALSLKLFQFSPKNMCCGERKMHVSMDCDIYKKQLVECDGSLYVIDLFIDDKKYYNGYFSKDVFVEVFKLDQEWGKWLDVKDLGDVSFVLGKDSNFALLAKDYYGCEGNCIYFSSQFRSFCFSLESLVSKPPNIFWPCPTLFKPKNE